jgi:hypothetical protein
MRNYVIVAVLSISAFAFAGGFAPGSYPERAETWKKFTVQGIELGTPLSKLSGFTCDDKPGEYQHTCVKFLDPKCKGRKTYVKFINFSSDVPKGQGCTYNSENGATYLDRQSPTVPLFTFVLDQLTDDSNIGKALIAKYGTPDYKNAPMQMRWNAPGINDLYLMAECGGSAGPDAHCLVEAHDGPLLDAERSIKQAAGDEAKIKGGPAAPKL